MRAHILGLGESLQFFRPDGSLTIGVNDICKHYTPDIVVCVDRPDRFEKERLQTIVSGKQKRFVTHLQQWRGHPMNGLDIQRIQPYNPRMLGKVLMHSNNSTFVAAVLAFMEGAKEIVLWGVDLNNHPHIKDQVAYRARQDFENLNQHLLVRGIKLYVGSPVSSLHKVLPVWTK